ncbi:AfsR/SARP family transcriptional regulator [Saccharothrix variisporea]|uniref:DNA-binding SARP family transcriptional activator n=1 Tax=Saccharothrix variisporea TaxID=543527 RepID=A0A495X4E0_9PSEU|nr:AfsR/SARP family transcriptional regulator [Saccharothrix variisporea]RKT67974.1 DNA-binding SARP family transcriptional activator [Saccharothrix variisporea]
MWLFRLLGPVRLERDGREVPVGTPQTKVVLATLAAHANEVVTLDRMAEELWGHVRPASATPQLHGIIWRLRRVLGRDRIETARPGYVLRASTAELEHQAFRYDVACARGMLARGDVPSGAARLRVALARWRGPALAEVRGAAHLASALDEDRVTALEDRVDADLLLGRGPELVGELTNLVAEHPVRERLRGQLMTALASAGRVVEALDAYAAFRGTLVAELGVEPSARLRDLHTEILRGTEIPRGTAAGRHHPTAVPWCHGQGRNEVTRLRCSGSRSPWNPGSTMKMRSLNPPAS